MPLTLTTALVAGTLSLAGVFGLAGDTPQTAAGSQVIYCSGCLCQNDQPRMSVPGEWVPSGRMGNRVTLRFVPNDPARRLASSCRPPSRG